MDQEFSTRQTAESKSGGSSFRMEKSDICDPARLSVRVHPVCVVQQLFTPGSRFSSCSIRGRHKYVAKIQSEEDGEKLQQDINLHQVPDIHCQIDSSQSLAQLTSARDGTHSYTYVWESFHIFIMARQRPFCTLSRFKLLQVDQGSSVPRAKCSFGMIPLSRNSVDRSPGAFHSSTHNVVRASCFEVLSASVESRKLFLDGSMCLAGRWPWSGCIG